MFGSILEQTNECSNAYKENLVRTLKMATRNNKSSTPLKGANEPNLKSFYDLWGFEKQKKFGQRERSSSKGPQYPHVSS
jgi:hypothetical protein